MDLHGLTRVLEPGAAGRAGQTGPPSDAVRELAKQAARTNRAFRLRLNGNAPLYDVEAAISSIDGAEVRLTMNGRRYALVGDARHDAVYLFYERPTGKRTFVCRVESICNVENDN